MYFYPDSLVVAAQCVELLASLVGSHPSLLDTRPIRNVDNKVHVSLVQAPETLGLVEPQIVSFGSLCLCNLLAALRLMQANTG